MIEDAPLWNTIKFLMFKHTVHQKSIVDTSVCYFQNENIPKKNISATVQYLIDNHS